MTAASPITDQTEAETFADYQVARERFLKAPTDANRTKVLIALRRYLFTTGMPATDVSNDASRADADMRAFLAGGDRPSLAIGQRVADLENEHTRTAVGALGDRIAKLGDRS
ncbi:hypothetical protein [Microbaculum marinum]|uniref:Uncharacterized protein n=1 Tax=Microbaculum marinum TaxID=1764581 RepID=A0AAW9RUU7_9HYPH